MTTCPDCGARIDPGAAVCPTCGARRGDANPFVPPKAAEAPFGNTPGGREKRISGRSKLALTMAFVFPPVGLVLGILATRAAVKLRGRPGNLAVAIAAICTSLHFGAAYTAATVSIIQEEMRRSEPVLSYDDDPWASPATPGSTSEAELQRLLEDLQQQQ